jgi:hypothetical protein
MQISDLVFIGIKSSVVALNGASGEQVGVLSFRLEFRQCPLTEGQNPRHG